MEQIFYDFFQLLASKSNHLLPYLKRRASCEKWIQGEFIHYLNECKEKVDEADLEKSYGPRKGLCDIWFRAQGKEIWCELEVVVTNYGGSGKPITNQVDHVIEDIFKLGKCPGQGNERFVMFLAYPFMRDGSHDDIWTTKHLNRIKDCADLVLKPFVFLLKGDFEARIYLGKPA